jgi:hypothetical protein
VLIHYGSYETKFLKRSVDRYGVPSSRSAITWAINNSVNVLSALFGQVYFPTFSNTLKDIGQYLGAKWSGPLRSGLQSLAYRHEWNQSLDPGLKAALMSYNCEDCAAVEAVTTGLVEIIREAPARHDVEFSDKPKRVSSDKGAKIHDSLESIIKSAHFTYQYSRIKLRTTEVRQRGKEKVSGRVRRRSFSTIKGKRVGVPRRRICPNHPGHKLSASSRISQHSLLDLIFTRTGCRKTVSDTQA